ncbi:hypothetical protein Q8A67_012337 [Cirrhinus molitorella]|uniref:Uncharacterized protein n=1 Tax=Cirrhinus molitorella TaxID=172907 RepID=A0AA88PMS9_9TELE|nr:hypothetical protein Q8A67_012337 [Cirrhinus molitorella]
MQDSAEATSFQDFLMSATSRMDRQEGQILATGQAVQNLVAQVSELSSQLQQLRLRAASAPPPDFVKSTVARTPSSCSGADEVVNLSNVPKEYHDLKEVFTGVRGISYHAACTISPVDATVDVFWTRFELQEVVGRRGSLFSVHSLSEAANYQSSMDHHELDIDPVLRQIFRDNGCHVNIVQLYATTPHCRFPLDINHPVSRLITTCGLNNPKHTSMLMSQASKYLVHMEDLLRKTMCGMHMKMEAVFLVAPDFPLVTDPRNFFVTVPMIMEFKDDDNGFGLRNVIHSVAGHLTQSLGDLFSAKKGLGGFSSSWRTYQLKLTLEELYFSNVKGKLSQQYAVALGCNQADQPSNGLVLSLQGLLKDFQRSRQNQKSSWSHVLRQQQCQPMCTAGGLSLRSHLWT